MHLNKNISINSQWAQTLCGHTKIDNKLATNVPFSKMRGDKISPKYVFDKNYTVFLPSRDNWSTQNVRLTDDIICFTDGSKHPGLGQTGASVYNQTTNKVYMFPLDTYKTVFQAEVYAICACAKTLLMESEASIAICSDSQAALMALRSSKITSSLVAETIKALTELSMFNSIRLLWIPGHSDIPGNETADQFAK